MKDVKNRIDKSAGAGKKSRWLFFVIPALVVAAVITASAVYYYQSNIAPYRQPVLKVDGTVVRMDYFLKRVKLAEEDPGVMLEQLAYEQVVKLEAPQYGIEVSQSDIDELLQRRAAAQNPAGSAAAENTQVSDSEFQEWYRQQLETTGLSDTEYQEVIRINLLSTRLRDYVTETMPATADQVHLFVMALATYQDAQEAKARINSGENFADVAREVSVDPMSKANGGDLGWIPRGVIPYDEVVFQLEVGILSDPVMIDASAPGTSQYALFLVSEKAQDREIEAYLLQILSYGEFHNWLEQAMSRHEIEYYLDPETRAWVGEQLAKSTDE